MTDDLNVTESDRVKYDKIQKAKQFEEKINQAVDLGSKLEDKMDKLYEKVCEGPDCLEKKIDNKFGELSEKVKTIEEKTTGFICESCGYQNVPALASFCPNCGSPIHEWNDDDGEPIKGWKHWNDRNA
jgi:rubrerythrin